jgi:cytochrome P450
MVATTTSTLLRQAVDPAHRANPYPLYAELRRIPVSLQDDGTYVISTYRETRQLLRDPRISSDLRNRAEPPRRLQDSALAVNPTFLSLDPPAHDHGRRLVMTQFGPPHTPGRVEGMRARIEEVATQLIDAQAGRRRIDIVESLAFPLPVAVICDLLGVPIADAERLHAWSNAVVSRIDPASVSQATEEQRQQVNQAEAEFAEYMGALLAERRKQPGDDVLSALVCSEDSASRLSDADATTTAMLLMIAGHETTVNLIANGVLTFLRHPEVLDRLHHQPDLMIGAVEELLRYEPPVQFRERTTLTDMEVAGVRIPKGAPLVMLLAAANRDEARFANADQFMPDREDNQHLGFLTGIHYCFGAPLARLEAQIALREFIRRFNGPRLVVDPPPYRPNAMLRGPSQLEIDVQRVRESQKGSRGMAA